jgi:hypothetical protein
LVGNLNLPRPAAWADRIGPSGRKILHGVAARARNGKPIKVRRGAGWRSDPPGPWGWDVAARSRFGGWLDEILHRLVQGILNGLANLLLGARKN